MQHRFHCTTKHQFGNPCAPVCCHDNHIGLTIRRRINNGINGITPNSFNRNFEAVLLDTTFHLLQIGS